MTKASSPIPEGFHTLTPQITVKGAPEYIDFLKRAFDAVELSRSLGPGGKIMNAGLRIGDSVFMLNDHFPEFGAPPIPEGAPPFTLHLYVPDCDAVFAKATAAGCKAVMPMSDAFWGDRYGQVTDPYGFRWSIATRKETVTPEELQQRQAAAFSRRTSNA